MNLKEYLDLTGISVKGLSYITGVSIQSLYNYLDGRLPAIEVAQKLEKNTSGRITVKALMEKK